MSFFGMMTATSLLNVAPHWCHSDDLLLTFRFILYHRPYHLGLIFSLDTLARTHTHNRLVIANCVHYATTYTFSK